MSCVLPVNRSLPFFRNIVSCMKKASVYECVFTIFACSYAYCTFPVTKRALTHADSSNAWCDPVSRIEKSAKNDSSHKDDVMLRY